MKTYRVGVVFVVQAEDEEHATEQYIELLHDNGDTPNELTELE